MTPSKQAWAHLLSQSFLFHFPQVPGAEWCCQHQLCPECLCRSGDLAAVSALSQLHCSAALMAWAGSLCWLLRVSGLRGLGPHSVLKEWHSFPGAVSCGDARAPSCSRCQEHRCSRAWLRAVSMCSQGRRATPAIPSPVVLVQQPQQFQGAKELGYRGEFSLLLQLFSV